MEGRKEGREGGRKEGRKDGWKEAREEGRTEGRKEGRKKGRKERRKEGSQDGEHHLFNISFMRGSTSTLRWKEHQETEDHDHELSPRLDRKETRNAVFFPPPGGKKLTQETGGPSPGGVRLVGRVRFFMARR